ncbi:MAG: hypothetical protein M3093_03980 [Thermoproteota archaeon]|nr:hypothetical protein [Thermoproteota archaeon]
MTGSSLEEQASAFLDRSKQQQQEEEEEGKGNWFQKSITDYLNHLKKRVIVDKNLPQVLFTPTLRR